MLSSTYNCGLFLCLGFLHTIQKSRGIKYIDVHIQNEEQNDTDSDINQYDLISKPNPSKDTSDSRRNWLVSSNLNQHSPSKLTETEDEKDEKLKSKIAMLVEQTVHDTTRKVEMVSHVKEQLRNQGPYKVGFVLSLIKKSKDVLTELFNVAVKHKNDWKALEQLKIFELIVHTNVDVTNLVRQLVEIHVQFLNSTSNDHGNKRRMVLLK